MVELSLAFTVEKLVFIKERKKNSWKSFRCTVNPPCSGLGALHTASTPERASWGRKATLGFIFVFEAEMYMTATANDDYVYRKWMWS